MNRSLLIALLLIGLAALAPSPVRAHDHTYLIDSPHWNPPPSQDLKGVNAPWLINGAKYGLCFNAPGVPQYLLDAAANWEAVLGGIQFDTGCSVPAIDLISGSSQDCDGYTACVGLVGAPAGDRGTTYTSRASIAYDAAQFDPLAYSVKVALMTHELGHVFGLDEYYLHDSEYSAGSASCNPSPPASVMNLVGCPQGSAVPTTRDIQAVQWLYGIRPVTQLTAADVGSDLRVQFWQDNVAESGYHMSAWEFDLSTGQEIVRDTWFHSSMVGLRNQYLQTAYIKPQQRGAGFYRVCVQPYNAIYGYLALQCTGYFYLLALDGDGDGFTDRAEGVWPLCRDERNEDYSEDPIVDDGCPIAGGVSESGNQCISTINDDPWNDPIVNDGCAVSGAYNESAFDIGTDGTDGCGQDAWPADLADGGGTFSRNKVNTVDLTAYLAPVRRLNTSPGSGAYSPRWDVFPGHGLFFSPWINVQDLSTIQTVRPTMPPFYGQVAFNSPIECIP